MAVGAANVDVAETGRELHGLPQTLPRLVTCHRAGCVRRLIARDLLHLPRYTFALGQSNPMRLRIHELIPVGLRETPAQLEHATERGTRARGLAIDDQHVEIGQRTHGLVIKRSPRESSRGTCWKHAIIGAARGLSASELPVRRDSCLVEGMSFDEENAQIEHSLELPHETNSRSGRLRRTLSAVAVAVCLSGAGALIIDALHIRQAQNATRDEQNATRDEQNATRDEQNARDEQRAASAGRASPAAGTSAPEAPAALPTPPSPEAIQPPNAQPSNIAPGSLAASANSTHARSVHPPSGPQRASTHRSRSTAIPTVRSDVDRGLHPTQDFSNLPEPTDSPPRDLSSGVTGNDIPAQGISDGSIRGPGPNPALPNGNSSEPSPGLPNGRSDTSSPDTSDF